MGLVVGGGGDEGLGVGEVVVGVAGLVGGGVVGQENGDGVIAGREGVLAAAVGVVVSVMRCSRCGCAAGEEKVPLTQRSSHRDTTRG